MKKIFYIIALAGLLVGLNPVLAGQPATLNLPPQASEVAKNVFYLGTAYDADSGQMVEGYAIVHKVNNAKGGNGVKPNKPSGDDKCYSFIAKGAKWKNGEPWVMNTKNPDKLNGDVLFDIVSKGIGKWETAAVSQNILGDGSTTTSDLLADYGTLNSANEVYFDLLQPGTIAVTIIWGNFSGPIFTRELVEWDQVYNTYYNWSAGDKGVDKKMDFDNIATHELGHSFGLADLYNSSCSQQTMYGYADFAETNKRDLESGDIAGIRELYK